MSKFWLCVIIIANHNAQIWDFSQNVTLKIFEKSSPAVSKLHGKDPFIYPDVALCCKSELLHWHAITVFCPMY